MRRPEGHSQFSWRSSSLVLSGGWGRRRIPIGFGFAGKGFQVDFIEIKTVMGYCFKCKTDGHFDLPSRKPKIVTRYPRKINNKINAAALVK